MRFKMNSLIASKKRAILKEDEYQATLSDIISRDYFPHVDELKKQMGLLQHRDAGDTSGGVRLVKRYHRSSQQSESGESAEQYTTSVDSGGLTGASKLFHLESLSGFHARVTSEDNASFDQVQSEETRHQAKISELCNSSTSFKKRAHPALRSSSHVLSPLPLASEQFDPPSHQRFISDYEKEPRNSFFFVPGARQKSDHQMLAVICPSDSSEILNQGRRISSTQTMPPPINMGDIYKRNLTSQKEIVPSATRFPVKVLASNPVVNNNWDVENQTDYWSSTDDGSETTDLDSSPRFPLHVEKMQAIKQRKRDLSKFVRMTPLVVPGARGTEESSPLITWGAVEGTPLVVPNLDTPVPPMFRLPEMSARDDAATKAQERLCHRPRSLQQGDLVMEAQRSTKHMRDNSSAHRTRPLSARSGSSLGSALRKSYLRTPVSVQRESGSNAKPPSTDTAYQLTPQLPRKLG